MKIRRPYLERGFIVLKCTDLTKENVGRIIMHRYRVVGIVRRAYFFPASRTVRYDVPRKALRDLMRCESEAEAIDVLYWA